MSLTAAETTNTDSFDLIVLGGGSAGYSAALRASELGMAVALVEADKIGGTCLHHGCIPTKALLHSAELAESIRQAERFGVSATLTGIDGAAMLEQRATVIATLHRGVRGLIRARKVTVVEGRGELRHDGSHPSVVVTEGDQTRTLRAAHVVLATGARSRMLPGAVLDRRRVLDSTQALALPEVPGSAVIIGGGVIGVEFASAWAGLGARVTVLEAADRLLPSEDDPSAKQVDKALRARGIDIRVGTRFDGIRASSTGVEVAAGGDRITADVALVAVGRVPNGEPFAEAGVELDGSWVVTDERLATNLPGVFAAGDLVAGPQLAHRGFAHGIFVAEEIAHRRGRLDDAPSPVVDAWLPRVTYCHPQLASVGAATGTPGTETYLYDLAGNGRAQILGERGQVRVVHRGTDGEPGEVVGIHIVGPQAGDLISEAQLIVGWQAMPTDVADLVHAHPTLSEALGEAHLALAGKPLHVHR
ncbi:dihydrolipoyl dehydrogenase [Parenemella sanctibonifatiensis]|uniref:Dihydrolipoyl dehydrogenase n=1 Tax=Parenemella sanctibonifatiensis TaxID=2016505 RepID=A0A255EEV9_9ACTN|nr:dihydrolipoyl dehydrogenase [Parenemella sanctibonifatiensis]OYN89770.1 dihydrolipoyl dehydrogenase [Parenemella sanctibonifatiensis]